MSDLVFLGFAFLLSFSSDFFNRPQKTFLQNWLEKNLEFLFQSALIFIFYEVFFFFVQSVTYLDALIVIIMFLPGYVLLKWRKKGAFLMLVAMSFSWALFIFSPSSLAMKLSFFFQASITMLLLRSLLEGLKHRILFSNPSPSWQGLPLYTLTAGLLAFVWAGLKTALMF